MSTPTKLKHKSKHDDPINIYALHRLSCSPLFNGKPKRNRSYLSKV